MINKERFHKMHHPKSIVVFGRSWADAVIRENIKFGFEGELWAVHPTLDELEGVKVYRSIAELPGIPDAAFVAVNAEVAIAIVNELNEIGCGGVVLFTSGFKELADEEGIERQARLVAAASDMPLIGPNCYGVVNALDKSILWPDLHGLAPISKGVAIITQSGNIGVNLTMQQRGLPLAYLCTIGNQALINMADMVDVMLDDNRISAIGLHIEGIHSVIEFDCVARRALERRVPIVVLKTGRSEVSAKIAMSHTSSLTGSDALFDALFERVGIARVDTVTEFLETLKLLSIIGPLEGNKIASMSCSGGEAGMIADLIELRQVEFPEMDSEHIDRVRLTLNEFVNVSNPLDYHTFIWGDRAKKTATFTAMKSGGYDATMLLLDWPNVTGGDPVAWDAAMLALADAKDATGHAGIVLASMHECLPPHAITTCLERGLAPMIGLNTCLKALDAAYHIGQSMSSQMPLPLSVPVCNESESIIFDEWRSKQALKEFGLKIPESVLVKTEDEAVMAANNMGYPVVLKGVGQHLIHKTEMGAVHLGLESECAVRIAFKAMEGLSSKYMVEKMVPDFIAELIIGVSRDVQFGPSIVIGAGGILVEILHDSAVLLLPTKRNRVEEAIKSLKIYKILKGYRAKPAADINAVIDAVMVIADFVSANKNTLLELDVNPLMVFEEGQGVIAADALIRTVEKE